MKLLGKTMENARSHRNIKLVITEKRKNYLVSEPNYHTTKRFIETLLAIEMRKTQISIDKNVDLSLSILEMQFVIWIQTASFFM